MALNLWQVQQLIPNTNMLHTGTPTSCRRDILTSILYKWSSKSYRNECGGNCSEMSPASLAGSTAPCMSPADTWAFPSYRYALWMCCCCVWEAPLPGLPITLIWSQLSQWAHLAWLGWIGSQLDVLADAVGAGRRSGARNICSSSGDDLSSAQL